MAYDDATRVDNNTTVMENGTGERTAIRAAAKVFGEAVYDQMVVYGAATKDKQWFRDAFIDMLRDLSHKMKDK